MQNSYLSSPQNALAAELLAVIMLRLFPNVVLGGGGINSLGFFYDFILEQPLTEGLLELIEVELQRYIKEEHPIRFISMMRENAQNFFEHQEHFLLAQQAGEASFNIVELIQIEDFSDLCEVLPFNSTLEAGYIKIIEVKEFKKEIEGEEVVITRLIGVSQNSGRDLKKFVKNYDNFLKKRDHRLLGPQLNLFSFCPQMGSLGIIWHPNGMVLRRVLQDWLERSWPEPQRLISTPAAALLDFLSPESQALTPFIFEEYPYRLRVSPLRQHLEFLNTHSESLDDLPRQVTEYAAVYRHYSESQWWGLFCTCGYLMDFTTICCIREGVASKVISSLHFIEQIITIFGFEAQWSLVAARHKTLKSRQEQEAVKELKQAIQGSPRAYPFSLEVREEEGEETPRLELRIRDVLGREWPASTVHVALEAKVKGLSIVTRQVWGSLDRFIALLVERYEGNFPLWLAPEQVRVMAIGEANQAYAQQVYQTLRQKGLRVGLDLRQAKLSMRVHEAEKENVPYLVLLGEQERMKQKISVRRTERFNDNQTVDLETFLNKVHQESLSPNPLMEDKLKGESELA